MYAMMMYVMMNDDGDTDGDGDMLPKQEVTKLILHPVCEKVDKS